MHWTLHPVNGLTWEAVVAFVASVGAAFAMALKAAIEVGRVQQTIERQGERLEERTAHMDHLLDTFIAENREFRQHTKRNFKDLFNKFDGLKDDLGGRDGIRPSGSLASRPRATITITTERHHDVSRRGRARSSDGSLDGGARYRDPTATERCYARQGDRASGKVLQPRYGADGQRARMY